MTGILPPDRKYWHAKATVDPEATVNMLLDIIDEDRAKIARAIDATSAGYDQSKYAMAKSVADALFGRDQ